MINDKEMVQVTNRDGWTAGYQIPEMNVTRRFTQGETKMISAMELRRLSWLPGGRALIRDHLIVKNEELVNELLSNNVEPEYYYTTEDVRELLLNGSEDQLRDALDFAPQGVISLIKDVAVELKLNDMRKREIILAATNFDVTNAIRVNEESEVKVEEVKTRRATPVNAEVADTTPARRAAVPRYKVTTTENK